MKAWEFRLAAFDPKTEMIQIDAEAAGCASVLHRMADSEAAVVAGTCR